MDKVINKIMIIRTIFKSIQVTLLGIIMIFCIKKRCGMFYLIS